MPQKVQREILIASYNRGKEREIAEASRGLPVQLRLLSEFPNIETVDETGKTYEENAVLKALSYSKQTGLLSIADDSGLEVDALGGRPGIFSARYAGDDAPNEHRIKKLLRELELTKAEERTARFICSMAVAGWDAQTDAPLAEPQVLQISEGVCEGSINFAPVGSNGFGFDPVFVPSGYDRTFAELPDRIKNLISHRAQAIARMRESLTLFLSQT